MQATQKPTRLAHTRVMEVQNDVIRATFLQPSSYTYNICRQNASQSSHSQSGQLTSPGKQATPKSKRGSWPSSGYTSVSACHPLASSSPKRKLLCWACDKKLKASSNRGLSHRPVGKCPVSACSARRPPGGSLQSPGSPCPSR